MLGLGTRLPQIARGPREARFTPPPGLDWPEGQWPLDVRRRGGRYSVGLDPRSLVHPGIWTGAAIHVDGVAGVDTNSGLGAADGDFSAAKRTIHAAFTAGNATANPYRVIVKPGTFSNTSFTNNGSVNPNQPCAIIGWNGRVDYRAGAWTQSWALNAGTTYTQNITSVQRVFRTDVLTPQGLYTELPLAADLATCQAATGSWFKDGSDNIFVNIGKLPGASDVAVIRAFNGAQFLTHAADLYLENIHCQGGITGALHCDAVASRNIVGVNCSFRYSSPSTSAPVPLDAVQIRRTAGLVAFFDCDASGGAKDGWNFHEDGNPAMNVLLVNCTGFRNGALGATSVNAFTTHDGVRAAVLGGQFGFSANGTEIHCIEATKSWLLGVRATARDPDGTCTGFKCSNTSQMWLEDTLADAAGGTENHGIEANDGGQMFTRRHFNITGDDHPTNGGVIGPF